MKTLNVLLIGAALVAIAGQGSSQAGQGPGRGRGQGPGAAVQPSNLPDHPVAVALPEISAEVTGPGTMYASVQSLAPGMGLAHFNYEAREYFISGTANGSPYKTRIVVRKPANNAKFNGLVLAEPMHPSGSAHMFEFTSIYGMSSGYIAIDMLIVGMPQVIEHNPERYKDFKVEASQANEIMAQVGALLRSSASGNPLAGLGMRKMILAGTSATSAMLVNYLPAHMVYRTADMQRIFDGFMPTSNGSLIRQVDVPLIQVPTMLEVRGAAVTSRQDGDAAGDQYRDYEFPGMGHVDSRDNVRLIPNPCKFPTNHFPAQAFMSVALHHLFQWVDKGIVPPGADRIWKDRNEKNDGSPMAMDEHGNPRGGVRNTYVDVPTARYNVPNEAAAELIPNASEYVAKGGMPAARQMCGLASYEIAYTKAELKQLYGSKQNYRRKVEARLTELEKAGWSLPVYRDMILADAAKVEF